MGKSNAPRPAGPTRHLPLLILAAVAGLTLIVFPPVRFHSLKAMRAAAGAGEGQSTKSIETLWRDELLPAAERSADVSAVVRQIAADPKAVRARFGRAVGVSDSYFLFVRGTGRVVHVDADGVAVSLAPTGDLPDVVMPLGFIFGNAVRDGSGLVEASSYPNAQDFNDVSAKLNELVEKQVLPPLQTVAKPGATIEFAGCAEVSDETSDLKPLTVVPVYVRAP